MTGAAPVQAEEAAVGSRHDGGVVDFHCHVPDAAFVPPGFVDATVAAIVRNLELRGTPVTSTAVDRLVAATFNDPELDRLTAHMDHAGIDLAVLVVPDFTHRLGGGSIEDLLSRTAAIMSRYPSRYAGLAGVDPRWGDDGLRVFERAVTEWGFRGLKVYPPCGLQPSDRAFYPFYEVCAARGLPVMVHTGGSAACLDVEPARPLALDAAARDFPNVDFVLAHGCANLLDETVTMLTFRPNVFADTSALPAGADHLLRAAVARGVGYRLVYGSDWPVFQAQGGFSAQLERLSAPDGPLSALPASQRRAVFGDTARALLGLSATGLAQRAAGKVETA